MPKYLSGRVKRTPQGSLTTDRYQYLGLEQAEPNLGDPPELDAIPGGQQYQIVSLISNPGERFWVPIGGGIQPGSVTVRDEGSVVPRTDANPNLGVSSITDINFVGTAVTVVGSINPDGGAGIAVTVKVAPPGDNFQILFNNIDDQFGASPNFVFDNTIGIGSVGIGTSTPTQNLHVVGNVKLDKTIYGEDNQPGTTGDLLVKTATGGVKWTGSGAVTSGAGGTITQIQFHDDTGLVNGASNFVFDSTNSRIGIGSTQPDRLLDVLGNSRFTGVTTFSGELDVVGHVELDNLNVSGVSTFNDDVIFAGNNHNITFDKSLDDLVFDDNAKLTFGIGSTTVNLFYKPDTRDFRHEFNGGANYVLLTNTFDLKSADASKAAITAFDPGGVPEVRLFNDGNEKLRTTGYGVTVFGQLETTDIFASGDVGIGTTNPTASNIESALESNTNVLAVGILTANQIFGKVTSIQETIDLETLNVTGVTSTNNLLVTGIATFDHSVSIGGTLTYEDVTNVDSIGIITAGKGFRATSGGLSVSGVSTFIGGASGAEQVKIQSQGGGAAIFIANYQGVTDAGDNGRLGVGKSDNALIFTNASASQVGVFAIGNTDAVPLVFSTANTERLRIAGDGDVGIGTNNALARLDVYKGTSATDVDIFSVRSKTGAFNIQCSDTDAANPEWRLRTYSNEDLVFSPGGTGSSGEKVRITSAGKVGVGTTNPTAYLQVYRATEFAGNPIIQARSNNGSTNELKFEIDGDGDAYFNGNVGIGTTNPTNNLQVNAASNESTISLFNAGTKKSAFQASNNFGTIIYSYDSEPLIFSVHSGSSFSEKLRITEDGNVGIGTSIPDGKLHVFERVSNSVGVATLLTLHSNRNDMASGVLAGGSIRFFNTDDNNRGQAFIQAVAPLSYGDPNDEGKREDTVDFNFVQSNGSLDTLNTNLTIKGETGNVGIGTNDPDGKLHVFKGFAGNVTADSDANNIVIESNTDPGISFLSPNNEQARIKFADPDDTDVGAITYNHNNDTLSMRAGGFTVIGITSTKTTIEGDLDVDGAITYSTVADVNSVGVVTAQDGIHVTGAGITVVGVATFHDNVNILNLTEDRVVFVGAGRTLTDSSNLTFYEEKEVLSIGGSVGIGTTNPKAQLHIGPKNGDITSHLFLASGNNDYGFKIDTQDYGSQNVPLRIIRTRNNNDSEVIRVTQDGEVGIGITNPAYTLDFGESSSTIRLNGGNNGTAIRMGAGGSGNDFTLLRVDGATDDHDGESDNSNFGFSLKYMGSRSGNDNSLSLFADDQEGTQFEAITVLQDGKVGIGTAIPSNELTLFGDDPIIEIIEKSANSKVTIGTGTVQGFINIQKADGTRTVQISSDGDTYFNGGDVGIGTTNPLQKLDVRGTIGISTTTDTTVRTTITSSAAGLFVNHGDNSPTIFQNQGIERFRITKDGDVGIGTDNPTGVKALTNNNNTLAVGILTANQIFGSLQGAIVPDGDLVVDGHLLVTGVSTFVGVATFGNVGIGGSLPDDFLTNKFVVGDGGGSRGMTIYSDGTLGQIYFADGNSGDDRKRGGIVYDHSQNELKFSVNAVEKFVIDSDGDVGIGTSAPTSKFDVHMNDKSGVNFLNLSNNSAIDLKSNQVESCGRIQVSESVGGGVMILSTKNTSGNVTERLRINTNGDVTTTSDTTFDRATAGFTARKGDSVNITRAGGTPLEINRTTDDGNLINFFQDGTQEANISIDGDDLIFGNTTEKFRINSGGAKVTGNLEVTGTLTYEDVTNIETVGIITTSGGIDVTGGGIDVTNSSGIRVSGISTFYDNVNFQDRVLIGREVGTAIQGVVGHADSQLQVVGTGDSCGISIIRYSNDASSGSLTFAKSKSPTIGTNTATQFGDFLGQILFNAADQSAGGGDLANSGARIKAQVTGTVAPGAEADIPSSLIFETSADDTALLKERMRIGHNGLIGMGGTDRALGNNSQYSRLIVCGNNDSTSGYGVLTIQAQSSVLHQSTIGTLVFADRRGDFANITAFTDATTGGSDFPGRLSFATTPDGATVPTNKLTILSGGNVGIGSEIPQYKLEVAGTVAATNFDSLSDRKVKKNIQIIQNPIDKIKKIDGVSFNWKSDNKPSLGVIADNVQSVLPEIVSNNDPKSVNYNGLIGLLIEVVKDQQKQIEELRGLIDK